MKSNGCNNSKPEVKIVGKNFMQNQLLASFIKKNTDLDCTQLSDNDLSSITEKESHDYFFFLLDAKGEKFYQLWDNLNSESHPRESNCIYAVFNLDPNSIDEMEAVKRGIEGLFYNNEPIGIIPKGIQAIIDGEMWYSRKIISQYLLTSKKHKGIQGEVSVTLTDREKDILKKLFSGQSNLEIADDFSISYNTVKTHIYNIYKKINVDNRSQATLWASEHL